MKDRLFKILFCLLSVLVFSVFADIAEADDWSDLDEGEHEIYGSEKDEKYPVNMLFLEKEKWSNHYSFMALWLYKYTDYPKYASTRFLPFYYNIESKIDNRKKRIVPFFWYNRVEGNSDLLVTPIFYSNRNSGDSDISWLYLFWWGKSGTDYKTSYNFFIPLLFYNSDGRTKDGSDTDSLLINPLFVSKYNTGNNSAYKHRTNFSLLHYYESDTWPDKNETTWWAPIIPVTYHHTSADGGHRNVLFLLDYSWKTDGPVDKWERFWLAPFWFWEGGDNGYNNILPPIYIDSRNANGESYWHILPFFIYKKDISHNYTTFNKTIITLFSYHSKEFKGDKKWDGDLTRQTEWYPIIPLYFAHTDSGRGTHRNFLWLFDWHSSKENGIDRFWFIPVWLKGKNYRHFLLPLYMNFKQDNDGYYTHFLPLLIFNWRSFEKNYSNSDKNYESKVYKETRLSFIYSSTGKYAVNGETESELYKSFWLPIIPLFYRSTHKEEGSHTNLFWLIDWASNKEGNTERFWFIPFAFHQPGDSGYRFYFPFYFRPSGNTEKSGLSFGLFHYHSWSPEKRIMWLGPCFAQYYPEKKEHFGMLLPVYAAWKTQKSEGEILLPWSITYRDNKRSLYVNIFGISKSAVLGPLNPEVSLGAGTYNGRWYFDTDVSWLYNVFSVSTRISVKNPWSGGESVPDIKSPEEGSDIREIFADEFNAGPSLKKDRELSRDTSEFFWGYKLLFGWFAYEHGDTKRHIRLIPLGWFTWDKKSDDKLYTIPFAFLSYKSQDIEYFVLYPLFIPIYGYQRDRESYARGFFINAYWDEYNADEKLREQTILWPLINWYRSPRKHGWRIFPVIWHKEASKDDSQISKYIIPPLLFYSNYETDRNNNLKNKSVINPLYYSRKTTSASETSETTTIPIIPLIYYYSSNTTIYSFGSNTGASDSATGAKIKTITRTMNHFLPLLYFSWDTITIWENNREEKESNTFCLGYYRSANQKEEKSSVLFGLFSRKKNIADDSSKTGLLYGLFRYSSGKESQFYFIPFWYYNSYNNIINNQQKRSFISPVYYSRKTTSASETSETTMLPIIPLIYYSSSDKTIYSFGRDTNTADSISGAKVKSITHSTRHILPLLYFSWDKTTVLENNKEENESSNFLLGFYWGSNQRETKKSLLFGLFSWKNNLTDDSSKTGLLYGLFRYASGKESQFYFIPFWYYYSSQSEWHFNLLLFADYKSEENYKRFFLFPFWYTSTENGNSHSNILGLIDWKRGHDSKLTRSWFLPFYLWYPGEESDLFIFPLLTYYGSSPKETTKFILGYYSYSSDSYERQNFLYLFDRRKYHEDHKEYNYLFGTIHYETTQYKTEWKLAFGILMDYEGYKNSENYKFDFLLFISNWERNGDYYQSSILPLWYYKENKNDWSFLTPVGLSYFSKDRNGDLDLGLLGLLYFRNNDIPEKSDTRAVLGGALYWEREKPERGYHSFGSLWGVLWDYETESETGFKKLSILKIPVYKSKGSGEEK
ncbi:MAG: hypothetical protein V1874_17665 [Spirochaetota bacterium]